MTKTPKKKDYTANVRASIDGHRFHWYWTAHESLKLLDPSQSLAKIGVEGLGSETPIEGEEIADVVRYFRSSAGGSISDDKQIVQIKYATKKPGIPYGWTYLRKTLVKFAALYKAQCIGDKESTLESTTTFLFLSNRPAAEKFKKFFEAPELGSQVHHPFTLLKSATSKLGLTDDELIDFAQRCTLEDNAPLIHDVVVQGRRVASNLAPGDVDLP